MIDPIAAKTVIDMTGKALNTDSGKGFIKMIGHYCGGANFEIEQAKTKGKSKAWEKGAEEMEVMKIDFEKKKLEKKLIKRLDESNKSFEWSNLFSSVKKVFKYLPEKIISNTPINIDNLKLLLDESKNISSEEMQEYVAKIIAKEYSEPNSISRQTIRIVNSMTKQEFNLFENFGSLVWNNQYLISSFFTSDNLLDLKYKNYSFFDLQKLQSLGLISSLESIRKSELHNSNKIYTCYINKKPFQFSFIRNDLLIEVFELTSSGKEILTFLQPKIDKVYLEWAIKFYKTKGFELIS